MNRKTVSGMMFTLLLIGMLTSTLNIQPVNAIGTIYIRPDGSIDPPTAPMVRDGDLYTLTGNITSDADGIAIERDGVTLDGAGYTIRGALSGYGITLWGRKNVTVRNTRIGRFWEGIYLSSSENISIVSNSIQYSWQQETSNWYGIVLTDSDHNTISSNNITANSINGIELRHDSDHNTIIGNNITGNDWGIKLEGWLDWTCDNNNIRENIIEKNGCGISLEECPYNNVHVNKMNNNDRGIEILYSSDWNHIYENDIAGGFVGLTIHQSSYNTVYHNNVLDSVYFSALISLAPFNSWDDGYPSGGNYWSDHISTDSHLGPGQNITGGDGIGDESYIIDSENQDNYPLMEQYVQGNLSVSIYTDKDTYHTGETMHLGLNITNPDSVKYQCFALVLEFPDSALYPVMHQHSVVLPIGMEYSNSSFRMFTLPSLPSGTYIWHVAILDRGTHPIIVQDMAEWEFS